MYSCVKVYTRSNVPGSKFNEQPIGFALGTVRSYLEHGDCYLVLTNAATLNTYLLNLVDASNLIYTKNPDLTIVQWLAAIGDASLPVVIIDPAKFGIKKNVVKYNDLINAGYDPQLAHPTIGAGNELPYSELTDVTITKAGADYLKVVRNCLFTVNGLFHIADHSTAGIRLTDAGRSVYHSNANQFGIISFQKLGEITCIPIKKEMLKPLTPEGKLKDGFSISFGQDINISEKIVLLSLGGVFHHSNQCYRPQGDNSMVIEWWKVPFRRRYFDTKRFIDLSSFEDTFDRNPGHHDTLDIVKASTDEAIGAYMELSQTFVILLDAKSMYWDMEEVEQTDLPGRYYTYSRPSAPLLLDNGFMAEYVAKPENGTWVLAIDNGYNYYYYEETKPPETNDYIPDAEVSRKPYRYCRGWLLEMGSEHLG